MPAPLAGCPRTKAGPVAEWPRAPAINSEGRSGAGRRLGAYGDFLVACEQADRSDTETIVANGAPTACGIEQWQYTMSTNGPMISYRSAPQRQVP